MCTLDASEGRLMIARALCVDGLVAVLCITIRPSTPQMEYNKPVILADKRPA